MEKCYGNDLLVKELKACFDFFTDATNNNENSKGYGLIKDKHPYPDKVCSIASVGFGLCSLIIGTERKWIEKSEAYNKTNKTLDTLLNNVKNINGFYYHFFNIESLEREYNSEISIIDTALMLCGALTAGEYFGGEVKEKAEKLYLRVNWNWFLNKEKNYFYMGYSLENGFWGHWNWYAEQLILYVLAVGSPTFNVDTKIYDGFNKPKKDYGDIKDIVYTYCGTLFAYQYSHAFIDFRNKKDKNGVDWFENSKRATLANRQYCIDNKSKYKTYGENSWGLTPCITPSGYKIIGSEPCEVDLSLENNGTISPCGAIGSIVFTPNESIKAMENYYNNFDLLFNEYGFVDGFNLENGFWKSKEYIGIDKGISMVMIENYLSNLIWKYFMQNQFVKNGLEKLNIK